MDRKVAKELLHVRDWPDRAQDVAARGHEVVHDRRATFRKPSAP